MAYDPTPEQLACLELFRFGDNLAIEAGAGTGKTSTLVLLAENAATRVTGSRGQYVAFNKAIVTEAAAKMPGNMAANTAHSLAFRAIGKRYQHRLRGGRMRSTELARVMGIDPFVVTTTVGRKVLAGGFLAGQLMQGIGRFCQSADETPAPRHLPYIEGIDLPDAETGARTWANNELVRSYLEEFLAPAWSDLMDTGGRLPYKHEHYLKAWQLSRPRLATDFILFDEAQDANPVMLAVVAAQECQQVYVGDSQQAIYEFTGAVNALAKVPAQQRRFLTQSFRFGTDIAKVANHVLGKIDGADLRLVGSPGIASEVGPIAMDAADALLTRTNAAALKAMMGELREGRRPHLVGGGGEIVQFAKAAGDLMAGRPTFFPDLACFETWGEVQEYVENDPAGGELKLMVGIMDDYGPSTILGALDQQAPEAHADLVISTAHKSKGREWDSVVIGPDFPDPKKDPNQELSAAELRLIYVACTRARRNLDVDAVPLFQDPGDPVR